MATLSLATSREFTSSMTMLPYMCGSLKPSDLMNTHSYVIKATKSYETVATMRLYDPWPLHCRKLEVDGRIQQMQILKYHILGTVVPDSEF